MGGKRPAALFPMARSVQFPRAAGAFYARADPCHQHCGGGRAGGAADDDHRRTLLQYAADDARPCACTKAGGH